jgi:hypothetical protein
MIGLGWCARARPGPLVRIKDTSQEEIKRVFDEDMANYKPPDFDHDPYAGT